MNKNFLVAGAIFAGLAVAIGAFGAHGLQKLTQDPKIISSFQTGVQYQFWHAIALLFVAILFENFDRRYLKWSGNAFIAGILFFSGSLYSLSLLKINGSASAKWLGPVTPIGGLLFILGWIFVVIACMNKRNS